MFSSLKWLSFTKRIKYQQSILMYKIVNWLTPDYLAILNIDDVQRHNLRSVSNNDLFVPRPNTKFYKKSFHYSATKVWINLPLEIKNFLKWNYSRNIVIIIFLKIICKSNNLFFSNFKLYQILSFITLCIFQ